MKHWICLAVAIVVALSIEIETAGADDSGMPQWLVQRMALRTSNRRDSAEMMAICKPLTKDAAQSVVQIVADAKPVALGAIVSADGYVLTKRSELTVDPIRVRLADGRLLPARVAAVRRRNDLALLRIEDVEASLPVIKFVDEPTPVGSFLISVGRGGNGTLGLGVISVSARRVEHNGKLGIVFSRRQNDATVQQVLNASGADTAGVVPGDQIVAVNGRNQSDRESVMRMLRDLFPGESARLTILRGGETLNLEAKIQDLGLMQESENDSKVNGQRSTRLSGFEYVTQHDTVLDPNECGGPVVDSKGRCIGINIARAGRVVSYALPASSILPDLESMLQEARGTATVDR